MIDFVKSCLTTGVSRDYKQLSDVLASVDTAFSQWRQPLTHPPPKGKRVHSGYFGIESDKSCAPSS